MSADRRTSWTADELMTTTFPEPRWAVNGIVAEGLTLLAGAPKLGKSWFALNAACAIAAGGVAFGRIPVDPGDVLYLALEDTGRRLQRRLGLILGSDPAPARLVLATELPPMSNGGAERMTEWLDDHPDARLVVIDVLAKVRGRSAPNVPIYEADYLAMSALKAIADTYNVAVVVVHHTRKTTAEDFLDTVSGSQGLAGSADTVAVLTRSRGSADAVLKITGRDVEESERAFDFDPRTGLWRLLDGQAADYQLGATRRRILEATRTIEGATPRMIAEALGDITEGNVKVTVRRMVDDGQLDTDGHGHYFPPVCPVTPVTPLPTPGNRVTGETHIAEGVS